jgi:single-stranded-DNA-specific exonuclease
MAAGLALLPEKLAEFRTHLNEIARRSLTPEQLLPSLRLDAEIAPGDLTLARVEELRGLQQTGMGNPAAQFMFRNVFHERPGQRMGPDKKHARLWITDGVDTREAIMWGVGENALPSGRFDLAFTPQLNDFNGARSIQLKVLDWRPTEAAP